MPTQIGPFQGVYNPDYDLRFWTEGDPRRPVKHVDFRSALSINTSKNLTDISGTFSITLKDHRARRALHPMDVGLIGLGGHGAAMQTVLKCVVDDVGEATDANGNTVSELTQVTGRCLGKYLQINSMFLPVWDASGALPTALIFGMGDITDKVQGNIVKRSTPRSIMDYLVKRFVYGKRGKAGFPGTPNARFWLEPTKRFEDIGFHVPFIQFNEDAVASAAKQLEVLGFSECWMDELGAIVYRHPQWDQPADYLIPTDSLIRDTLSESDVGCATYIEVIPAGDPGIDAAASQALRAGRAPIPASYLKTQKARDKANVTAEFVIDTDSAGNVTAKGEKNYWRRKQRLLGVRPQQVISPLLWDRQQAQAQAEGLLRFYSRLQKSGTITTPMRSDARIGRNLRLYGRLNGVNVDTVYYVEGIAHQYIEGGECTTVWTVTHGADRGDPRWGRISLPTFDPATLAAASGGGVLLPLTGLIPDGPVPMSGGLASPFGNNVPAITRIDQGIDTHLPSGDPFIAMADLEYVTSSSFAPYGSIYTYRITSGDYKDEYVYFAEGVDRVQTGRISQGQVVCYSNGASSGQEVGWSTKSGRPLAEVRKHVSMTPNARAGGGLHHSPEGENFFALMKVNGFVTGF